MCNVSGQRFSLNKDLPGADEIHGAGSRSKVMPAGMGKCGSGAGP
jgi:hypothetical protein